MSEKLDKKRKRIAEENIRSSKKIAPEKVAAQVSFNLQHENREWCPVVGAC
jgi:hypothetical protein